jgi:hypothetical protein
MKKPFLKMKDSTEFFSNGDQPTAVKQKLSCNFSKLAFFCSLTISLGMVVPRAGKQVRIDSAQM